MPSVHLNDQSIDINNYRRVEDGEQVKWSYQWYNFTSSRWQISSLRKGEKLVVSPDRSPPYREPVSIGAWITTIRMVVGRKLGK